MIEIKTVKKKLLRKQMNKKFLNNERRNAKNSSKSNDNRGLPWKAGEVPLENELALELCKFLEYQHILLLFSRKYQIIYAFEKCPKINLLEK